MGVRHKADPNGSAADSILNDSLGSAQAGIWPRKQKTCYQVNKILNSAFLRNLVRRSHYFSYPPQWSATPGI